MDASFPPPRLELVRQTSLHEEKISRNGQPYNIFVVVKNSPFQIICSIDDANRLLNFNNCSFDVKLVYDMENEKEVAWVNTKPVECKPTINESGDQISFDAIKIKVLSSHHEDNFFRLKIEMWDPRDESQRMSVLSHPIKVISKPLKHRVKKTKEPQYFGFGETPRTKRSYNEMHDSYNQLDNNMLFCKIDMLIEEQRKAKEELNLLRKDIANNVSIPEENVKRIHGTEPQSSIMNEKIECM